MPPKKQNKRSSPEPVDPAEEEEKQVVVEEPQEKRQKQVAAGQQQQRLVDGLPKVSRVNDQAYLDADRNEDVQYMRGFGGHFSSEALPGALPEYGNAPKRSV